MSKSQQLTIDPVSRSILKRLEQRWLLRRKKVGIRNIIRAASGSVECYGLNLHATCLFHERLANFHPNAPRMSAWVAYQDGRAELTATHGHSAWVNTLYDLSSIFPVNAMATDLMYDPATKSSGYLPPNLTFYGDAELITDSRMHWFFINWKAEAEDILSFNEMLTTPRTVLYQDAKPQIFFHEQPHQGDVMTMQMTWM
jgi:hypothetical protein